ncbi:hypothetical protein SAMN05443144_113153 [Fodinibius roseus]|uniref:Uncharacterized protein n=1 Tax=Fodinibius roseus TaxID=1194090 RepID=A0A1M5ESI7_9BACT|nr:hypothetical protein [Fodinibius roseus]SHF82189.1 hypothetical protein SAMN05443144_113153 [Fodinibius roseus]
MGISGIDIFRDKETGEEIKVINDTSETDKVTQEGECYFKEITGFSPKFCQKLDKFKQGLRQYKLHGYNFNHWEYGFTDFSHFAKVSKQLTTWPPSDL